MADDVQPLSSEERAELEALRAKKAAREERERAVRERAELEALCAEQTDTANERQASPVSGQQPRRKATEEDLRIKEARERGAKLMEPDDDLRMPLGQKVVLGVLALLVLIVVIMTFLIG